MKNKDMLLLVGLMALWGLNFSVIKLGVNQINPFILVALRFFCVVFPLILFIKKPDVKWRYLVSYGLCFGVGVWGLTTLSIHLGVSAGMASLLLNMSIVSSLLIGRFFLNEDVNRNKLAGAILALLGLFLIMQDNGGAVTVAGVIFVLIASVCWSINGLILKRANTKAVFAFNIWAMLFAPLPLVLMAVTTQGLEVLIALPNQLNGFAVFSVLFQAYPTTLLGYWLWNKMIVRYSLSTVAPMTLLVPVFGIFGGYVFYDESVLLSQIIATVLILVGVYLSQREKPIKLGSVRLSGPIRFK